MRNVLKSTHEVLHYWANKVQPSGRCGNVSFDGDKLYSYRALIGRHLPDGSVAISSSRWSATTAQHQSGARAAARHLNTIMVSDPASLYHSKRFAETEIKAMLERASTARSNRDVYISRAVELADSFNAFAKALRNGAPLADGEVEWHIDGAAIAGQDLTAIRAMVKAEHAKAKAAREERDRLDRLEAAEAIAEWRAGNPNVRTWAFSGSTVLRISGDEVQTSRGARIPVDHAIRFWPLVQRVIRSGKAYTPGDRVVHLGAYQLTRIKADGSIVVGCHDIPYSELEIIAGRLGLIREAVAA